jgi:flagellar FliL protein
VTDVTGTDLEGDEGSVPTKSKKWLIVAILLSLVGGGTSFGAVYLGFLDSLLPNSKSDTLGDAAITTNPDGEIVTTFDPTAIPEAQALLANPNATFHPLDPISVTIGDGGNNRQVRIGTVLEIEPSKINDVINISPRILDGLLSYVRAVPQSMLDDPAALIKMRSQMLRRARLIAGQDTVINLLIIDFVLN